MLNSADNRYRESLSTAGEPLQSEPVNRTEAAQQYSVAVYTIAELPEVIDNWWQQQLADTLTPSAARANPAMVRVLADSDNVDCRVCVVSNARGTPCALAAVRRLSHWVKFDVANRLLFQRGLLLTEILGGEPLVADAQCHSTLLQGILSVWPDSQGLYLDSVPMQCEWTTFLSSWHQTPRSTYLYTPFVDRPWHLIDVQATFDDYLKIMSSRSRQQRRREVRKLAEPGEVVFQRYESADKISEFLLTAELVSQHTWQNDLLDLKLVNDAPTRSRFTQLANAGLLRCYGLCCGEQAMAFLVGYQTAGVFEVAELGFHADFAKFSPGTVMVYKMIEDLHSYRAPRLINFGVGDATYKKRFKNRQEFDQCVIVLKSGISNRVLTGSHRLFLNSLEAIKRVVGRQTKS